MVILGHGESSGILSGNCCDSSVQGQPVLPTGGGGSSFNVGQRIDYSFPDSKFLNSLCNDPPSLSLMFAFSGFFEAIRFT